jgi:hypothetical protein
MFGMPTALLSFVRLSTVLVGGENLPDDLVAVYFEQANTQLKDGLGTLLRVAFRTPRTDRARVHRRAPPGDGGFKDSAAITN